MVLKLISVSTMAGVKLHMCFDILTGKLRWFKMTPGSTHDRKFFPDLESLIGKLIITDLGYCNINLLLQRDWWIFPVSY